MAAKKKPSSSKNPPFPSHDFFIQNHGDIAVCAMAVVFLGLVFQATIELSSKIIFLNYNISTENRSELQNRFHSYAYYVAGPFDWLNIAYYSVGAIIFHALIQEYILDKLGKKLHLSKSKNAKFNESGQLAVFYAISVGLAVYICYLEDFFSTPSIIWSDYPQVFHMTLQKFFFIVQLAYWFHVFPELYLQRIRKEDMSSHSTYASLYIVFITAGYFMNFSRLALILLSLHYVAELLFHVSRFLKLIDWPECTRIMFVLWALVFISTRFITGAIAWLALWVGFAKFDVKNIDIKSGNFNTATIRAVGLAAICLLQIWLMWNFINFQLQYYRDSTTSQPPSYLEILEEEHTPDQGKKKKKRMVESHYDKTGSPRVRQRPAKAK